MGYVQHIKKSLKLLLFDEKILARVSKDKKATRYGLITLLIAGLAMGISEWDLYSIIASPILLIVTFFIFYSVYHFVARCFLGGKATGEQYFRCMSNATVIYWFTFVPVLGIFLRYIAEVWLLVVNIIVLHKVHKLSLPRAVILGLLPTLVLLALFILGVFVYVSTAQA